MLTIFEEQTHEREAIYSTLLAGLITGDIVDEGAYGPDLAPDWDNTDDGDALPRRRPEPPLPARQQEDQGAHVPGVPQPYLCHE